MAKIKFWCTHKQARTFVLDCQASVQIDNNGTLNITIPKELALKLGFDNTQD